MKRVLLAALLSCFAIASVRADLIWYESFNYADGSLTNSGLWFKHSGTGSPSDALVKNHKLENSASSPGVVPRSDDVNRPLCTSSCVYTSSPTVLYASFTVNCTNLPNGAGTYFAHFQASSSIFYGRVYAMTNGTVQPKTWRLGIAGGSGTARVYPVDLAINTDYQVVVQWDPVTLFAATLWVNPVNSSDASLTSNDAVSAPSTTIAYGFRQAGSFGNWFGTISNLAVATTWDEAATNVWTTNALTPAIVYQPKGNTNFAYNTFSIGAVASGQGLGSMTYQWLENGTNLLVNPLGNTNVWTFNGAQPGDSGNYQMIATTPYGLSVTSAIASVLVTNSTIPPIITQQPATNTLAYTHQNITLTVAAIGPPTINYAWFYNNTSVTVISNPNVSGDGTPTLTLNDAQTNNGIAGTYRCEVWNDNGTNKSSNAVVVVSDPSPVSIGYLRKLINPTTFDPTNSTLMYNVTGVITTHTNTTTGTTAGFYLQDSTGGINIFVTGTSTWRPAFGDEVTFSGYLSTYQGTMELIADTTLPATSWQTLSNNIAGVPIPKLLAWDGLATNLNPVLETNAEGSLVMLTNVYFGTNAGTMTPTNAAVNPLTYMVTNASGKVGYINFAAQVNLDTLGQTLPTFAYAVVGALNQNTNNHAGYQVFVTSWADIVTNAPAITLDTPASGASFQAPASIALTATVISNDYPISYVGFYNGATLLGNVTNPPYSYTWNGVVSNSYSLTAKVVYPLYGNSLAISSAANSITVTNPPPTIALNTPTNGASYYALASIPLAATVTSNNNAIASVVFYNGATPITTVTAPPYAYNWTSVGAGSYNISAKATYGAGNSAFSTTNAVSVLNLVAPTISGLSGNSLSYSGGAGLRFVLLKTTDLTQPKIAWTRDQTNTASSGSFTIPVGSEARAFYTIKSE